MAWSRIQSLKTTPVSGNTLLSLGAAFASSVTAGNRVFVYTGHQSNTSLTDVNAPTDNQSNTYTKLIGGSVTGGSDKFWTDIWTAVASATGTLTITVTSPATTGGELGWTAEEYSGLDSSAGTGCLDVSATATGNYNVNATVSSGTTVATANAGQLAISAVADWGVSATWTVSSGTGFTKNTAASIDANPTTSVAAGNRLSGAGSLENCVWTAGVIDTDVAVVAVIKLAASSSPSLASPARPGRTWQRRFQHRQQKQQDAITASAPVNPPIALMVGRLRRFLPPPRRAQISASVSTVSATSGPLLIDGSTPASVNAGGTSATTAGFTPPANSLIVALAACGDNAGASSVTVTDSLSSVWTQKKNTTSAGSGAAAIYVMDAGASPASRTVTATQSTGLGVELSVIVFTGAQPLASQTATPVGQGTATLQAPVVTTTAGSYVVGVLAYNTSNIAGTLTEASTTTSINKFADTTNGQTMATFRSTNTIVTPGSASYGYTTSVAATSQMSLWEVLPAPGGTTASNWLPGFIIARRLGRIPRFRADGDSFEPPFSVTTPPVNPAITQLATGRVRRAASVLQRATSARPVPQVDPLAGTPRPRRASAPGRNRSRATAGAPLTAQGAIPGPTTRRRLSIMSARRRASGPVPVQTAAPTNPSITQTVFGRLRMVGRIRPPARVSNPTPAQQAAAPNPKITATVFGRLRTVGRIQPRAKVNNPVPAQQSATPNPRITATVFGRLRTVGRLQPRAKAVTPVPAQPRITQTVFGRLRTVGRIKPRAKVSNPIPAQQAATPNPQITATVFGRLRTVGRIQPRAKVNNPVPAQQSATPNPRITATVFGRLRTVGRLQPRAKAVTPVPVQAVIPVKAFGRLRSIGRTNRIPRVAKPIPPQANPVYPIRPSVGGLSGLRRVWLKIRRKNAYPVPAQVTTLSGPLTIQDSYGGVEADRNAGTVISGTYGSSSSSTVSKGSSGGFIAESDTDNVAPTYDSDSDSL